MEKLISYKNAPLVEVIIGIQLAEDIISNEFIFEFYSEYLKKSFPKIQEHQPLPAIVETKDASPHYTIQDGFNSRKFFIEEQSHRLLQIQSNRILFNWRALEQGESYPHYENVLNEFNIILGKIEEKLNKFDNINQLELTYVDHIVIEDFGLDTFNLGQVISFLGLDQDLKTLNFVYSIWHPAVQGNVNVNIKSAIRNSDQKKIIVFESTCRGSKNQNQSNDQWFNTAHKILLDLFENSITNKAKELWKKEF
jgi:uncharacterized protein (TIGR04255 family)